MANTKTKAAKPYIVTVGRRREAVARVRLYAQTAKSVSWGEQNLHAGDMLVNEKPIGQYFSGQAAYKEFMLPLELTKLTDKVIITAKTAGGGLSGQLDAFVHGLARAIDKLDSEKHHAVLKEHGLLTRDARARERRKVGMGGKARRKKQSPKR